MIIIIVIICYRSYNNNSLNSMNMCLFASSVFYICLYIFFLIINNI